MLNEENYNEKRENLMKILDNLKENNERKADSKDLLDTIDFIEDNFQNSIPDEYPMYIDFDDSRIRFNFWTYYDELEEYCNTDVVISKDFEKLSIKSNYGNINFYENYNMKKNKVEKSDVVPNEIINNDKNKSYKLNLEAKEQSFNREKSVIEYYVLCNKLKDLIRTGWKDWNVSRERVESVAEHIYGVQQLAIAMKYQYNYNIDLYKVIMMIALHETEEIVIGDLTQFQISKEEKEKMGHKAVHEIFTSIMPVVKLEDLIYEMDERKTNEAMFAYQCDKLECDLQARLYDEEKCVDLNNQDNNTTMNDSLVKVFLDNGMSFSEMWMSFGQKVYPYDKNFMSVSEYAMTHEISSYKLSK